VDVAEAARELDISTDAVRKRIARGSLLSEREDGGVRVWLDDGGTEAGREAQVEREALVEELREQVHYLRSILSEEREARRRADTIIAQLSQSNAVLARRVPELEAAVPSEPPGGGPQTAAEEPEGADQPTVGGAQEGAERPWWKRMFGGVGVRLARSLQLGAIAAFTLAVVAFALGETVAATVMFMVAAVGFLVVLVLQRRR
jgi:hypothetical protein